MLRNCLSSFFLFFLLVNFSGRTAKSFLVNVLSWVIKKACDQGLTHSLDTLKSFSVKIVPEVVVRDACGTWHGLCTVTSIHSIRKNTRNSQKLGNKLVRSVCQWMLAEDSIVKKRNELISKKVWRERKEKIIRLRSWLLLHVNQYKNCLRKLVIRKRITDILLVDNLIPSTNKPVSTNQWANESYSRISFTRSI